MRWPWQHRPVDDDARLIEAERRARELKERGEKVARSLEGRLRRNHWGQTIAEIARGHGRND